MSSGPLSIEDLDRAAIEIDHCAAGALPIIALIAFLMGLILAMQAWVQLRVWGAEIYIADMVGVSVLAEIGPLMTAIVLAARSGNLPPVVALPTTTITVTQTALSTTTETVTRTVTPTIGSNTGTGVAATGNSGRTYLDQSSFTGPR